MTSNLDRFRADLDRLIKETVPLRAAALRVADPDRFNDQLGKLYPEDSAKQTEFVKNLPSLYSGYEAWYSESIAIISQLLPSRLVDFKSQYEVPKGRREINNANYVVNDLLQGLSGGRGRADMSAGLSRFDIQINILKAARVRFDSSLFDIRQLLQADLFDTEIAVARELFKNGFLRAAGAVAGVVLESHLKQVCNDHGLKLKSRPTISTMNDALKDNNTISVPQWRFNQHLVDIRNQCDHAGATEPTKSDVESLIEGVQKVLKTIF